MKVKTAVFILFSFLILFVSFEFFPPGVRNKERFIVREGEQFLEIISNLEKEGFVKNKFIFAVVLFLRGGNIQAGGYKIYKGMNLWQVAGVFRNPPYMKWVTVPEGLRKEEIADILGNVLGWGEEKIADFLDAPDRIENVLSEGMYFPDTYLIPVEESGFEVAKRMFNRFNEKIAPYAEAFLEENIKWDTALKLASLVQREARGKNDMPLVAGILWNRLLKKIKLDVDATVQYARGKADGGWWAPLVPRDKEINSPYNTYLYKGLPPTPISNPGLDALEAVLRPEKTDCLYYLHDKEDKIHCSVTYEGHIENIRKFLQ